MLIVTVFIFNVKVPRLDLFKCTFVIRLDSHWGHGGRVQGRIKRHFLEQVSQPQCFTGSVGGYDT